MVFRTTRTTFSLPQTELHRGALTVRQDDREGVDTKRRSASYRNDDGECPASVTRNSRADASDVADDPWSTVEVRADDLDRDRSTNPRRTDDVRCL